jgi:hypothetical protein
MTSKIKVDNITNQSDSNIVNKCGTTITLGASGDTINLASGASQTGFGRTGTVDWDTTPKTTGFTAVSGNGYFVNTTSGAITVTLPATPSAGDIVSISDYAGTAATNNITIARNGSNFEGGTENGEIIVNRQAVTLIYVDATQGWVPTAESDSSFQQVLFVTATGGTITTCGNFKIHTFTGPGTFTVSCAGNSVGSNTVDYLVAAGAGAGGSGDVTGGGGAGGYRESSGAASGCYTASPLGACVSALPVSVQGYPITVGGGGTGSPWPTPGRGGQGSNSIFSSITSTGGGGGGGNPSVDVGGPGGSGGGSNYTRNCASGTGNTPPVSPPQGQNGGFGAGSAPPSFGGGGGGGAGSAGTNGTSSSGGPGGCGAFSNITGSPVGRSGGGGGAAESPGTAGAGAAAGGNGGTPSGRNGGNGSANRASGGGGGDCGTGGTGGSGIVIIRYKFQ